MAGWGDNTVDWMRERQRERELRPVLVGYEAAAEISLGALATALDTIEAKVEAGEALSAGEKALRTELHVIKTKIERSLKEYWHKTDEV
jgi:hypothetical protein